MPMGPTIVGLSRSPGQVKLLTVRDCRQNVCYNAPGKRTEAVWSVRKPQGNVPVQGRQRPELAVCWFKCSRACVLIRSSTPSR